jgi:DNA-binding MarR family transcriptional regulator
MNAEAIPVVEDAKPALKEGKETLTKKWTKPLIKAGYTAIPTILIHRMAVLGLDAMDFAIVAQLASYWWSHDRLAHPSMQTIALAIGVTESTVKKRIANLEKANLIRRIPRPQKGDRHKTNEYSFQPLIDALTPYAVEELEKIAERKAAKLKSLTKRGKPMLKAVPKPVK